MESWGTFGQLVGLLRMANTKRGSGEKEGLSLAEQRGGAEHIPARRMRLPQHSRAGPSPQHRMVAISISQGPQN